MSKQVAIVDGSNVAYLELSENNKPKIDNLRKVSKKLETKGYRPVVIIDASLRHEVDDPELLDELEDTGFLHQAPAGTDADYFIVETADRKDGIIVSNDTYEEYEEDYPWLPNRRVPLMIVEGEVELYFEKMDF
ncbi:hypothetical protein EU537_02775 [Candidatus Thorarchaeota archaeon]|nr:MAG: hypothetical protein EU537_02775 [Candidatus Thorarchaeota archaeon]